MPREESSVWFFYRDFLPDDKVKKTGKCKICGITVGLSKSTTNAELHLSAHRQDPATVGKVDELEAKRKKNTNSDKV